MKKLKRIYAFFRFLLYYTKELILSNLLVAYDAVTPTHHMHPGVVAVPLTIQSDLELFLLSNLISMTPGTLSLDVSHDKKLLFIHVLYLDDHEAFRKRIYQKFEKYILEILR